MNVTVSTSVIKEHETIDAYVTSLRTLAKTCNFGQLENDLIRDRIVMGIRDNTTRKKLLQVAKLSLSQCIDVCRSYEKTSQQLESMKSNEVQAFNKVLPQSTPTSKQKTGEQNLIRCKFCATTHTRDKFQCPAWGKTCSVCKRRNHFAAACSNKPQKTPHRSNRRMVSSIDHDTDSSEEYIATLTRSKLQVTPTKLQVTPTQLQVTLTKLQVTLVVLNARLTVACKWLYYLQPIYGDTDNVHIQGDTSEFISTLWYHSNSPLHHVCQ